MTIGDTTLSRAAALIRAEPPTDDQLLNDGTAAFADLLDILDAHGIDLPPDVMAAAKRAAETLIALRAEY